MEQVLAQAKAKITPASKVWDAQRAYDKRLTTTMSKDKGAHPSPRGGTQPANHFSAFAPTKGRRNKRKDAGASSGPEEAESEQEPPTDKKPRPEPRRKSKRLVPELQPATSYDQEGMETDTHSDKLTDLEDEEKPKEDEVEIEQGEPETPTTEWRGLSQNKGPSRTTSSPSPARTGALTGEDDVEMEDVEPAPSPTPEQTQERAIEEVVVRRKRLRP